MTEKLLKNALTLFGREITVIREGVSTEGKAFLEPSVSTGAEAAHSSLGRADGGRWKLITGLRLLPGDTVVCGKENYRVLSCAEIYAGGGDSHWEGLLEKERTI